MNYDQVFENAIATLRDEKRYRVFADLERDASRPPQAAFHAPTICAMSQSGARMTISAWAVIRR